ncbi:MAG: serine/threonine-protein phosphatase [Anaerolineae bacterium]|nr:serine/threonine-protein phosphatase [Anaerolineae bacterium]
MGFFRRLFGLPSDEVEANAPKETPLSGQAPEITAPGVAVDTTPPPIIDVTPPPTSQPPPTVQLDNVTRQLPPLESFVGKPGKHLSYGVSTHVGAVRTNNQDALLTMLSSAISADGYPEFGLFIVADGMGGHHDGERASALATRVVAEEFTASFYMKLLAKVPEEERPLVSEVLTQAVQHANEVISKEIPEGGTTVTAVAIVGDLAYIAHVGDSRAYLMVNSDGLDQITRDHSLVQRLIELDQLTQEEAASHPQRNVLYRAVGQSETVEIDTSTRRLAPGSRLILCSDGLWGQVPPDQLHQVIATSMSPQDACDRLVNIANERGGVDNVTVIIIQLPG